MFDVKGYTKFVWKTADGRRIRVNRMEDSHLVRAIRFLRARAEGWMFNEVMRMGMYAAMAPDGAAMAVEAEADRIASMTHDEYLTVTIPTYAAMLRELEKRKLKA